MVAIREFSSAQFRNEQYSIDRFDLSTGYRLDEVSLPFAPEDFGAVPTISLNPSLLTIVGADQICAISLSRPGYSKLLWQRNVSSENRTPFVPIPGPVGSGFVVWQSSTRLHCSHPMTGVDLWSRAIKSSHDENMFPMRHQLFGDEEVLLLCGADQETYERFRTRDGQRLGLGRLEMLSNVTSLSVGRRLIGNDDSWRVRLFDGLTETDVLQDERPVILSPETQAPFRELSEGRILTVTKDQEIVMIDTMREQVVFRTPTRGRNNTEFVMSLSAFERNGLLFVSLSDEIAMRERIIATPRLGEPRIDFGTLYCLNPQTGTILWSRRMEPSVLPPISGDPSGLLIGWSFLEEVDERRNGNRIAKRRLRVQVIDEQTGELLAERSNLYNGIPLRAIHEAETRRTTLYTYGSVITIAENRSFDDPYMP